jgi:hypothetical protein
MFSQAGAYEYENRALSSRDFIAMGRLFFIELEKGRCYTTTSKNISNFLPIASRDLVQCINEAHHDQSHR